ncbi:transmembrane amino acid transporter protein-domain-containing protein [Mycena olivaceomarginata]|nr:transmembrane amino acid transporter protein-domain-containing protein [Mycena olivaceomarginata]
MSSPSKPLNISPRRPGDPADGLGVPARCPGRHPTAPPIFGSCARSTQALLRRAISPCGPNPPTALFPSRPRSPARSKARAGLPRCRPTPSGTPDAELSNVNLDDLPDEEKARVLRRHLVSKEEREPPAAEAGGPARWGVRIPAVVFGREHSAQAGGHGAVSDPVPYAWGRHTTYTSGAPTSASSPHADVRQSLIAPRAATPDPAFDHIHEPGGFRRNYVLMRANERGEDEPVMLNNFIEFLYIFGHFAGEDLEEDEDEDEDEESTVVEPTENAPLLGTREVSRSMSRSRSRRRRMSSAGPHGNATVPQAVLMLLKAFVGTGVLFLGKAFYNGGILFSSLLFIFIALISLYSFLLLVYTKFRVSGSFGDIGGTLYGPWMRYLILGSIVVSQIGFVAAYIIFVAQNLQALVMGLTHCQHLVDIKYFILVQLVVFLPLVLIRDLAKLSSTALVADAFILVGLVYIFGSEISIVATQGIADVQLFNPRDFSLFVGVAVFSFEGVGMVIPITDAMREPHKFPKVLTGVMLGVLVLFGGAGALAYATFGSEIQTVVLVNLNAESKMVQSVQFIYSLAIMLSVPLQLFPAIRIMENALFTRSGKGDVRVKWTKNVFRFGTVGGAALLSWMGAADLDKFVAFIGCFACVPLCYVYPAMLHYKACADTKRKKAADIAIIVFGLIAAAYTTMQTVKLMLEPDTGGPPVFGGCVPPS